MSIRSSFLKVKAAVATMDTGAWSHVLVKDGWMYASNSRLLAAAPIDLPQDASFLVPGAEFGKVLAVLSDDAKLKIEDTKVGLNDGGRRRATIMTLPTDQFVVLPTEGEFTPVADGFLESLASVAPFMSEDKTKPWACAVRLKGEHVYATNNISVCRADTGEWEHDFDVTLPDWFVEYILSRDDEAVEFAVTARAISVKFADGSWARSVCLAQGMPDMVLNLADSVESPEFALTPEWLEAYHTAIQLADETVVIAPHQIKTGRGQASFEADADSPVQEETIWHPKFLNRVIAVATHFDPSHWPNPAPFTGAACCGVIVGRR